MILTPIVIADAPACNAANHEALVSVAASPSPNPAYYIKSRVTVVIAVTIGTDGKVVKARIVDSSNDSRVDQAALDAVKSTVYSPKVVNCEGVADTYIFNFTFDPTAAPPPTPRPTPGCAGRTQEATPIKVTRPDYGNVKRNNENFVVEIKLNVDAYGNVTKAELTRSSGSESVDSLTLAAAKSLAFTPKMVNCQAVDAVYIFRTIWHP